MKVHLDLRPGSSQEMSFTIGKSQDYPVDLYILCDLSASMRYARNYLAEQVGAIIGKSQFGYGVFTKQLLGGTSLHLWWALVLTQILNSYHNIQCSSARPAFCLWIRGVIL